MKIRINIILLILVAFVAICCDKSNNSKENILSESIDFDEATKTIVDSLIDSIEVIPLEIKPATYPSGALCIMAQDSMLFIKDSNNILFIYSDKGQYIADSKNKIGRGAGEYSMLMAFSYNQYSENIEIVTPAHLLFYDLEFNLIKSIDLPTKVSKDGEDPFFFGEIHDVSSTHHLLIPTGISQDNRQVILFDSKSGEIINRFNYDDGILTDICMQSNSFYEQPNGELLFFPPAISIYAYSMNPSDFTFHKDIKFSFGKDGISDNDISKFKSDINRLKHYILSCDKTMPIRYLLSGNTIIILTSNGNSFNNQHVLFCNRKTGAIKSINNVENDKIVFPIIDCVEDGYIFGITVSENLESILLNIDKEKIIMKDSEIAEECYTVLKYKLKN